MILLCYYGVVNLKSDICDLSSRLSLCHKYDAKGGYVNYEIASNEQALVKSVAGGGFCRVCYIYNMFKSIQ